VSEDRPRNHTLLKQGDNKMKVNNIRAKALHWWRALDNDMKTTMVLNPNINKTDDFNVKLISSSSFKVERMFKNWLEWEI